MQLYHKAKVIEQCFNSKPDIESYRDKLFAKSLKNASFIRFDHQLTNSRNEHAGYVTITEASSGSLHIHFYTFNPLQEEDKQAIYDAFRTEEEEHKKQL